MKGIVEESVRDAIIKAGLETAYSTGNSTDKLGEIVSTSKNLIDGGIVLVDIHRYII